MSHSSQLERWIEEERVIRARMDAGAGPGVATREQIAGKTGLQVMQGLLAGELPYASIAKTLNFVLVDVSEGQAIFQAPPKAAKSLALT